MKNVDNTLNHSPVFGTQQDSRIIPQANNAGDLIVAHSGSVLSAKKRYINQVLLMVLQLLQI